LNINKVIELQAIIDSLMSAEQSGMLDALAQSIENKQN
jgi:hypothetical protein